MSSAVTIPAAAGPVTALASRNGRYTGYSLTFTAAGRIRLWSGPIANPTAPTGAPAPVMLDEVDATAAGSFTLNLGSGPLDGKQYVGGIYVELVSGTIPEGTLTVTGPHS